MSISIEKQTNKQTVCFKIRTYTDTNLPLISILVVTGGFYQCTGLSKPGSSK